jgi:hypothetical protein
MRQAEEVLELVRGEFEVLKEDRVGRGREPGTFGYSSIHVDIRLQGPRAIEREAERLPAAEIAHLATTGAFAAHRLRLPETARSLMGVALGRVAQEEEYEELQAAVMTHLGIIEAGERNWEVARDLFARAEISEPWRPAALVFGGACLAALGDPTGAGEAWTEAYAIVGDEHKAELRSWLGALGRQDDL